MGRFLCSPPVIAALPRVDVEMEVVDGEEAQGVFGG
jgi:hypothetical protein